MSLLPVSRLVDGAPQSRAGSELAGVRAVGALQVAARPLQTATGAGARWCASPGRNIFKTLPGFFFHILLVNIVLTKCIININ